MNLESIIKALKKKKEDAVKNFNQGFTSTRQGKASALQTNVPSQASYNPNTRVLSIDKPKIDTTTPAYKVARGAYNTLVKPTIKTAKPILDYLDPRGYKAERTNPVLGTKKLVGAIKAAPKTAFEIAVNTYGAGALRKPVAVGITGALGAGISKLQGKDPYEGAGEFVGSLPAYETTGKVAGRILSPVVKKILDSKLSPLAKKTAINSLQGGAGLGLYSVIQPAKNIKERIKNTAGGVITGATIGAGTTLGGEAIKRGVKGYQKLTPKQRQAGFLGLGKNKKSYDFYRGEGGKPVASEVDTWGANAIGGRYLSRDAKYAGKFGKVTKESFRFDNPLVVRNQEQLQKVMDTSIKAGFDNPSQWAKAKGYDGIVDLNTDIVADLRKAKLPQIDLNAMVKADNIKERMADNFKVMDTNQVARPPFTPVSNTLDIGLSTKPVKASPQVRNVEVALKEGRISIEEARALVDDLKIQSQPRLSNPPVAQPQVGSQRPQTGSTLGDSGVPLNSSSYSISQDRGFTTSVKESGKVSKGTKTNVSGTYVPKSNKELMGEAQSLLNEGVSIKFKNIKGLDQKIAATMQEAINLDRAGNHQAAANLFNNLSEHGTELGRGVQAFSMLNKMSPQAIALSAAGKIKAYNATAKRPIPELTGSQQKIISDMVTRIDSLTGRERNIAINELQNTINNFIPSTLGDKLITVWKAGLLTSLRTHERNVLGNTIMNIGEITKDLPATLADKILAKQTGQRTITATIKGIGSGGKKGWQATKDVIKYGYDPEDSISKFDVHHVTWGNNPVEQALKKATNVVFRTLAGGDKPFWSAAYARSLYDQAGAQAINAGQQGNRIFIEKLVKKPTEQMLKTAFADANYATFHDKNGLSRLANSLKRTLSKNEWAKIGGEVLAPFTGVPSSIAGKTIAYSPIGLIRGINNARRIINPQQIANLDITELQRQASQQIGRGVVGSAIYLLGAYLMSKGLMTGQPKDQKESELWRLENKQANSIFINGKWRSINSIGPQNLIMLAGAKLQEEIQRDDSSLSKYTANLIKDQLSQTFLQGVQGPLNAINDPDRYAKSYVGGQVASVIPNIIKDVARATDKSARETNTFTDYFQAGVPILRNQLLPKRTVLGDVIPQEPTGLGAFIDLFNSKKPSEDAVVKEISRLYGAGVEAIPSVLQKSQTISGERVKLEPTQLNAMEAGIGEYLKPQLINVVASKEYKSLSDEDKGKVIDDLVRDVRKEYKSGKLKTENKDMEITQVFETAYDKHEDILDDLKGGKYDSLRSDDPRMSALALYRYLNSLEKGKRKEEYSNLQQYVDDETQKRFSGLLELVDRGYTLEDIKIASMPKEIRARALVSRLEKLNKENRLAKFIELRTAGLITQDVENAMKKIIDEEL